MATLTYAQSGVDRSAADRLVDRIASLAKSTHNRRVKASIGGYASLFELSPGKWLAASTDGVGTKLKLAFALKEHRTVGIDLVAMSVNDLLCVGAEPLFFLDYFSTSKLNLALAEQVLQGIAEGCRQAQCALVGGETAEMPDFYSGDEYDLAGFAVGSLNAKAALPKKVKPGDVLIGIGSSGCHSNGYSLLRKMLSQSGLNTQNAPDQALLTPTRIYVKALLPLIQKNAILGLAHITGSGFLNVPRISDQVSYEIHLPPHFETPEIFNWVRAQSGLNLSELAQTFNLGIGMVVAVSPKKAAAVLKAIRKKGEKTWEIGRVIKKRPKQGSQVILYDGNEQVVLDY